MTSSNTRSRNSYRSRRLIGAGRVWNRSIHLMHRVRAAFREGGGELFLRRLRRWSQHQSSRLFPSRSYQRWIEDQSPTTEELARQHEWAVSQCDPALISIVCPLYKTPINILKETIQSVLAQTYPYWELCLTICAEEAPQLRDLVTQFANADPRVRIVEIEINRGISANTNAALEAARGAWVAFLDHDDLLTPDSLYSVAKRISDHPDCDLIYSDEDLVSSTGRFRRSPMFKPDWSPEMLLHFNYICHFVAVRRDMLQRVGGLRPEVDGAQDWDLLLRISEKTQRIQHIPKILYHWRELRTSTAAQLDAKPYVIEAQKRALRDSLRRRGIIGEVDIRRNGHCHPRWTIHNPPTVSVIIPNRDQPNLIRQVVTGIFDHTDYKNVELIIVDNQSTHPDVLAYYDTVQKIRNVTVVDYPQRFNYSAACNLGAKSAHGEFLLFLNNDIEVEHRDWLTELVKWGLQPGVGMVGPHLVYPNGRTQHAGLVLGLFGLVGHNFYQCSPEADSPIGSAEWVRNVTAVTGACQLIGRDLFNQLGGFDEGYEILYSDIDLCLRVRHQGLRIVYTPHSQLVHHEAATRTANNENIEDAKRFAELLIALDIQNDPYFHPLLSARSTIPQLKPREGMNIVENLRQQIEETIGKSDLAIRRQRAA